MATCKACGREIAADMMFCPYCGTKRTLDSAGMPVDERPETKIGVIPYVTGQGRLEGIWTLIISDKRLVFAKAVQGDEIEPAEPTNVGLRMLTKRGPDSGCGITYAQRYQEMTQEEALKESSINFSIYLKDVNSVALSLKDEGTYCISIKTVEGDIVFFMPQQHDHRDYLMKVLSDKMSW